MNKVGWEERLSATYHCEVCFQVESAAVTLSKHDDYMYTSTH
jgi:hypothetical protein